MKLPVLSSKLQFSVGMVMMENLSRLFFFSQSITRNLEYKFDLNFVCGCYFCIFFFFFGVHPLRMTTTSSSTLKTQHEEEESIT